MIKNKILLDWIEEINNLCEPKDIIIWDGSQALFDRVSEDQVKTGKAIRLNPKKRPNSLLYRSHPSDVARIEKRTFISTSSRDTAGPTNNWINSEELKPIMLNLYKGSMKGRTMYVIPFSMGPIGLDMSRLGVEITDSAYVALNMQIMTRTGSKVIDLINQGQDFVKCLHSVGYPLENGMEDPAWPCAPIDEKYISHFPEENMIWSYGSGYGGNALLGKKCLALRIASSMAMKQGWLAEHMLILKLTDPSNQVRYITGAFPSACGKTNLAMINPSIKGWKAETVGDDIAWMHLKEDGRLYAINPEAGFFGVASGTSEKSNPNAIKTVSKNTIFTNVALTDDGDVWWKDLTDEEPDHLIDWHGNDWYKGDLMRPDHPNARFTSPLTNCPTLAENFEEPVPISAILFGGRRPTTIPLVHQSFNFKHGIFLGSIMGSEITAATIDENIGKIRRDPFAMLPFIGYNIKDYINHWASFIDKTKEDLLPKIFYVNWFRKDESGFLWPGFGDNARVLKWILERTENKDNFQETPIGYVPNLKAFDLDALDISKNNLKELTKVDRDVWLDEVKSIEKYFMDLYGDSLPILLKDELNQLKVRLNS
ncbi:phosphoenolpyruvate carboxykinase (GTP) [Hujiaoplasma nucleasis]|uniref:Phosphoenolpyruvate carboxykinase [GTP] n=1 Tax=Hujiaoplasma nucleasis TaxID=2725268 RepID=A0A7L6MZA2_9MOLU|nr:phosphoenolpyruvate carboxykinase (GTP) [Hujiaoplasma nucleasis]QLY39323.1 phosphoenolpyruvate carboxykinase (GTP) [Hujiaoplasma nucleasis]